MAQRRRQRGGGDSWPLVKHLWREARRFQYDENPDVEPDPVALLYADKASSMAKRLFKAGRLPPWASYFQHGLLSIGALAAGADVGSRGGDGPSPRSTLLREVA